MRTFNDYFLHLFSDLTKKINNNLSINNMDEWKKYIIAGNRRFSSSEFNAAKSSYEVAREHAENLFPKWKDPEEAASALVVTYHNLADLYQKQGNFSGAREALEKVHKIVLHALVSTSIGSSRHSSLLRASIKTYSALVIHKSCFSCSDYH